MWSCFKTNEEKNMEDMEGEDLCEDRKGCRDFVTRQPVGDICLPECQNI